MGNHDQPYFANSLSILADQYQQQPVTMPPDTINIHKRPTIVTNNREYRQKMVVHLRNDNGEDCGGSYAEVVPEICMAKFVVNADLPSRAIRAIPLWPISQLAPAKKSFSRWLSGLPNVVGQKINNVKPEALQLGVAGGWPLVAVMVR